MKAKTIYIPFSEDFKTFTVDERELFSVHFHDLLNGTELYSVEDALSQAFKMVMEERS